jgi:hypothetical protein
MEENKNNEISVQNIYLANFIYFLHILVILFVIFGPFSNIPSILIIHIAFSFSLLVHWVANNNACSLTYLESQLRGVDVEKSFTYKFISPVYDISKTDWSRICYIITIIGLTISIYKLWTSKEFSKSLNCYRNLSNDPKFNTLPFYQRFKMSILCFIDLFKINSHD